MIYSILFFSALYVLKGGQFNLNNARAFSVALAFAFPFFMTADYIFALKIMAAWCIAVFPSMGEEAGAVGRIGFWWGTYRGKGFSRLYGIKKALQRGCWMGSFFALATGNLLCIPILTLAFPFGHFIGQEIYYRLHGNDNWKYAEPIIGAAIGFCIQL